MRQLVQQKSGKAADEESEERNTGSEEDGEDELDSSDDEGSKGDASNDVVKGKRASRKKRLGGTKSYRDMYKALDGSALVALGIEGVTGMLTSHAERKITRNASARTYRTEFKAGASRWMGRRNGGAGGRSGRRTR